MAPVSLALATWQWFGVKTPGSSLKKKIESSRSRTDILLGDGVRPPVIAKHLVRQSDDTMTLNIAYLLAQETIVVVLAQSCSDLMQQQGFCLWPGFI